eukprot:15481116-Alexandrium_andersonii.AAC.1
MSYSGSSKGCARRWPVVPESERLWGVPFAEASPFPWGSLRSLLGLVNCVTALWRRFMRAEALTLSWPDERPRPRLRLTLRRRLEERRVLLRERLRE